MNRRLCWLWFKAVAILFLTMSLILISPFHFIVKWALSLWCGYVYGRALGEKVNEENL